MDSKTAFDGLLGKVHEELEAIKKGIVTLIQEGSLSQAQQAIETAKEIEAMGKEIEHLHQRWQSVFSGDTVLPQVSSPQPPVKKPHVSKRKRGLKTPESEYYKPILQVLVDMGGRGQITQVLKRVGNLMASQLNDYDRAMLPSGRDIRWENTAAWARHTLVKEGYLKNDSPIGIWEISKTGRAYLDDNQGTLELNK